MKCLKSETDFLTAEDENLRCGIYLRISRLDISVDNYDLTVQTRKCEEMIIAKGWLVDKIYLDEDVDGDIYPEDRPGLKQMIVDAREGNLDAIAFYSLNRLGTVYKIITETIKYLSALEIKIASATENLNPEEPYGMFNIDIMAAFSELEMKNINSKLNHIQDQKKLTRIDTSIF